MKPVTNFTKLYLRRKNYKEGSMNYELITEAILLYIDHTFKNIDVKNIK